MQPGAQQPQQTAGTGAAAAGRDTRFSPLELEHLRLALQASAVQHGTHLQHTPRNLVLALTGEVGSLAQLFQWRRDPPAGQINLTTSEQQQLSEQLSGILLHLIRLSDVCRVDLARAALEKLSRDYEAIQQLSQGKSLPPQQQQQHLAIGQQADQARPYMPSSPVAGSYTSSAAAAAAAVAAAAAAAAAADETASAGTEQHLAHYSVLETFAHPAAAAAAAAASTGLQLSVTQWGGSRSGFTGLRMLTQPSAQTTSTIATPSPHQTMLLQAGLSDSADRITAAAAAAAAAAAVGPPGGQVVPTPAAAAAAALEASAGDSSSTLSIDILKVLATLASEDPASAIGLLAANPTATETLLQALTDPVNPARALLPAALGQSGTQPGALQEAAGGPESAAAAIAAAAIATAALPSFREGPAAAAAAAAARSSTHQGRGLMRGREISAQLKREDLTAGSTTRRPRPGVTAAAAAAAGQQQQAADVSRRYMMANMAAEAAAPLAAAAGPAEAVERVMSGGLPPLPMQLAAAATAGVTPAPAAAAGQLAPTASHPSFGGSPATGSIQAPGGLIAHGPGATAHPAAGRSPKLQPISTPMAAAAAASTSTISPTNLPESEMEEFGTDVRRKRFSDNEVQALTRIAELANWSLTNLSLQEREAVCNAFHIGINRLQNFFNNRKPKGLKRGRPRAHHSHGAPYSMQGVQGYTGSEEEYELLQQQQQQQQQQAGLIPAEGGVGYGAAAAAFAGAAGLQERSSGPYYDFSQGRRHSHTLSTHQKQALTQLEPAAAAAAAAAGAAVGEETLASPYLKRRAASEQTYASHQPLAQQGSEGRVSQPTPQGSAGTMGQGLQLVRPIRVQRIHSHGAQGSELASQSFATTSQGFALTGQGLDLGPFGTPVAQGLQPEGTTARGSQGSAPTAMGLRSSEQQQHQQQQQQQGTSAAAIAADAVPLGPGDVSSGLEVQPAAAGIAEGPVLTPATTAPAPTAAAPGPVPIAAPAQAPAQAPVPVAAGPAAGLTVAVSGSPTTTGAAASNDPATDVGAATTTSPPAGWNPAEPAETQQ